MRRVLSTLRAIGWRAALADVLALICLVFSWWAAVVIAWALHLNP